MGRDLDTEVMVYGILIRTIDYDEDTKGYLSILDMIDRSSL